MGSKQIGLFKSVRNYYHTVHSGETLSWIAGWYGIPLADLMAWNGLNNASVIRPDQKLVLLVVPPATPTLTPSPVTMTTSLSPSITPSSTATPPVTDTEAPRKSGIGIMLGMITIAVAMGGLLWWRSSRKRPSQ